MSGADPITGAFRAMLRDVVRDVVREVLAESRTTSAAVPEWLSIQAAAEHFDVSPRCLADAGRRREIETSRIGQKTVVRVASVTAWIESRASHPANESAPVDIVEASARANAARRSGR